MAGGLEWTAIGFWTATFLVVSGVALMVIAEMRRRMRVATPPFQTVAWVALLDDGERYDRIIRQFGGHATDATRALANAIQVEDIVDGYFDIAARMGSLRALARHADRSAASLASVAQASPAEAGPYVLIALIAAVPTSAEFLPRADLKDDLRAVLAVMASIGDPVVHVGCAVATRTGRGEGVAAFERMLASTM